MEANAAAKTVVYPPSMLKIIEPMTIDFFIIREKCGVV